MTRHDEAVEALRKIQLIAETCDFGPGISKTGLDHIDEIATKVLARLDAVREFGDEPLGCPTPGACSCPPPIKEAR